MFSSSSAKSGAGAGSDADGVEGAEQAEGLETVRNLLKAKPVDIHGWKKVEMTKKRCMGKFMEIRMTRPTTVSLWKSSCTIIATIWAPTLV